MKERERERMNQTKDLGDFDLGDFDLGDFSLGDFSLGDFDLGDFDLGDFDLGDFDLGDFDLGDFDNILTFTFSLSVCLLRERTNERTNDILFFLSLRGEESSIFCSFIFF